MAVEEVVRTAKVKKRPTRRGHEKKFFLKEFTRPFVDEVIDFAQGLAAATIGGKDALDKWAAQNNRIRGRGLAVGLNLMLLLGSIPRFWGIQTI